MAVAMWGEGEHMVVMNLLYPGGKGVNCIKPYPTCDMTCCGMAYDMKGSKALTDADPLKTASEKRGDQKELKRYP